MKSMKGGVALRKKKNNSTDGVSSTGLAALSAIIFLLDRLSDFIYSSLQNSFFGKIFTSYSKEQEAYENSFLKSHFVKNESFGRFFRSIRKFFSRRIEDSFILNRLESFSNGIVTMPLKTLGNFWFSFGIYVVIVYLLRLFIPVISTASVDFAVVGVIICVSALPMLLSRDNIARAVGKSIIFGTLFKEALGYREESFKQRTSQNKLKSNLMMVLGMLLGILTLVIHPLTILGSIAVAVIFALILFSPEIGIIISLFGLPFYSLFNSPAITLGIVVFTTIISYTVKLVRGKRILKFEIMDLSVLLFGVIIYFSGAITSGGITGYNEALISCELMSVYFLIVNLIRTERWIKRCVAALVSSGVIVSLIGIAQYLVGYLPNNAWLDTDYFYDIKGRAVSLFENPNILAVYLVIVLPFALYMFSEAKSGKSKLLGGISIISILLCTVLTWSRGAWISAIFCVLLFALIYSKKTFRYIFLGCFIIPVLPFLLPQSVIRRFTSIGNLADSSTMYRVYTWRGTLNAIADNFMGGIGYGPTAFQSIYPQYAYAGIEAAEHSHNLFLQILLGTGISGLITFIIVIFLFAQMNFEYIKTSKDVSQKLIVAAAVCSVMSTLLFGVFDYVWYSYRIFFLFWAVIAIAAACVRVGKEEARRHKAEFIYNENEIF